MKLRLPQVNRLSMAWLMAVLLSFPMLSVEASDKLYRYRDSNGVLVIDYQIPPEYIAKGYDVLSSNGQVVQRIPPRAASGERLTEAQEAQLQMQRATDEHLMRSYSSIAEIESARDRKLKRLQREQELIERNLVQMAEALKDAELRAANQQRSGRELSEMLRQQLADLDKQQRDALEMRELRQAEYSELEQRYQFYIDRYRELTAANQ